MTTETTRALTERSERITARLRFLAERKIYPMAEENAPEPPNVSVQLKRDEIKTLMIVACQQFQDEMGDGGTAHELDKFIAKMQRYRRAMRTADARAMDMMEQRCDQAEAADRKNRGLS